MGTESDLESTLIRGASDSMACPFTSVCWNDRKHSGSNVQEGEPYLAVV